MRSGHRKKTIYLAAAVALLLLCIVAYFGISRKEREPMPDSAIVQGMELIAHFDFNDPVNGLRGAGAAATPHGRPRYWQGAARLGKHFWLEVTKEDGSPLLAGLSEFTVSYDAKPARSGNTGWTFFAARTDRPPKVQWESYLGILDTANGVNVERFHNRGARPGTLFAATGNDWRRVDVTFAQTETRLYINGELVDTRPSDYSPQQVISAHGGVLYIGRAIWGGGEHFSGLIDNFKIWVPPEAEHIEQAAGELPFIERADDLPATEAYLFVHFTGLEARPSDEQVYFAASLDGTTWQDLRPAGQPVLSSNQGDMGVRDPFMIRSPDGEKFYIIATDLSINRRGGWGYSGWMNSSTNIAIWESADLVNWSDMRLIDLAGCIPGAGNLWAPEAIYDHNTGDYFVFWATYTNARYQNDMYYARTRDFRTFTKPELWMAEEHGIIDTSVIEVDGVYYRASRDDSVGIRIDSSESLTGVWTTLGSLQGIFEDSWDFGAVEGPQWFLYNESDWLDGRPTWGLIVDQYQKGEGYRAFRTTDISDMSLNSWSLGEDIDFGELKKRHGSVLPITMEEYERLMGSFESYETNNPVLPGSYADPDILMYGGRYYLYPTTDGFPWWSGYTFSVFSSDNLIDWAGEGEILNLRADVPWSDGNAWAPAIEAKNGRFYFYFSGNDLTAPEPRKSIGVAVADSPTGPFTAMPAPLITLEDCRTAGVRMDQVIDPQIHTENGISYMLFGNGEPAIVQLGEDMVSWVPGTLRHIEGAYLFREAIAVNLIDGLYHFTWSCDDTGSENYHVRYGISDSLFGPIEHIGILLQKDPGRDILGTGHHSILHHPGFNEYFIFYHRFLTPLGQDLEGGLGNHREVCIDRLIYKNGRFQPVQPTNAGIAGPVYAQ